MELISIFTNWIAEEGIFVERILFLSRNFLTEAAKTFLLQAIMISLHLPQFSIFSATLCKKKTIKELALVNKPDSQWKLQSLYFNVTT